MRNYREIMAIKRVLAGSSIMRVDINRQPVSLFGSHEYEHSCRCRIPKCRYMTLAPVQRFITRIIGQADFAAIGEHILTLPSHLQTSPTHHFHCYTDFELLTVSLTTKMANQTLSLTFNHFRFPLPIVRFQSKEFNYPPKTTMFPAESESLCDTDLKLRRSYRNMTFPDLNVPP